MSGLVTFLGWALAVIGLSLFLGACRACHGLHQQFWRCGNCGFVRRWRDDAGGLFKPDGPYAVKRIVTVERCDGTATACMNSEMRLVIRKWSWWLTRPLAWVWSPLPALLATLRELRGNKEAR
ncbi:MAG: hypothetical protein AABZ30_10975 [Myxococcota bacterium]